MLDAQALVDSFGNLAIIGVCIILFLETATVLLSFLPGDSLLFVMGLWLAASTNPWLIALAVPALVASAVFGNQVGFWLGLRIGPSLFSRRRKTWFFNEKTLAKAQNILDRYGARAIILARFIPILRAVVPMLAGMLGMKAGKYLRYNLIGGVLWAGGLTLIGWGLGNIPEVKSHIELWILGFVILSSLPFPIEIFREWLKNRKKPAASTD